jgi:hypothetical protein
MYISDINGRLINNTLRFNVSVVVHGTFKSINEFASDLLSSGYYLTNKITDSNSNIYWLSCSEGLITFYTKPPVYALSLSSGDFSLANDYLTALATTIS